MSILFDEDSSSFGPTSADPMLAGINGATDELRFASAIETGTEGPEDEVLKAAGADNGVDELLVPQNGQGTLNVGKSGAEILEDSSGGKSPPGEKDTLTGEEDDVVIGEADSLTGGSSERVEISPRSGLRDARNNTRRTARNLRTLNGSRSFSDFVGTTDTNDYYRFRVTEDSDFDLTLNGLSGDADVQLLNRSGRTITSSVRSGSSAENISEELDSGTYYIRIYPMSGVNTNYNLSMRAQTATPPEYPGYTMSNARNLRTLSGSRSFRDFVGTADSNDYYRFYLSGERELDLTLNGLSGDADVQLLNSSGSLITSSTRGGTSADSISRTLDSGTYYIRVYPMSGVNTNYNLSLSAESVAPPDGAGNSMSSARNLSTLSGSRSFRDFVGTADSNDYYRFYLSGERELDLTLNGLSGDADVQLLNSSGSVITSSTRGGTSADSISRTLDSGTYYIRVYPMSGVNTNYNLSLSAESVAPPDGAGNSMSSARNLSTLSGSRSFSDFVGTADSNDYYRFYLSGERELDLTLNGLSGDADVQLLNSSGSVITSSTRGGTSADSISRTLDSGTYYIRVYPMSGVNTNYNLSLSAESVAPPDGAGNSMSSARNLSTLSGSRSFSDFVGTADSNDYYRFYLSGEREFDLTLNGLSGDADVRLLDSGGNTVASSRRGGTSADTISEELDSGTYYVRIYPMSRVNTNYNLSMRAQTATPPDYAGNTMSNARNLNTFSGSRSFRDFVGTADTNDYYRFYLSNDSDFSLTLNGLSGDADVRLLDSGGNTVASSRRGGTSADTISEELDSGTYYVRIYPMSRVNTNYNLSMRAQTATPPNPPTNNWFDRNLQDYDIRSEARSRFADNSLDRNDMLAIFRKAKDGGTIDSTELNSLKALVNNTSYIRMPEHVRVLSEKITDGDAANGRSGIGNLGSGSSDTKMERLVGKWFLGNDRPDIPSRYSYQRASGSLFRNGVSYQDIEQGELGDCYFLAGLGATAFRRPSTIQSMFTDNSDGTYTVRFYRNGQADYVTVDRYLPTNSSGRFVYANQEDGYNSSSNELWVALAEKAYAQVNESGWIEQDDANSYEGIEHGNGSYSMSHITGSSTTSNSISNTNSIIDSFGSGRMIVLGTKDNNVADNLVADHEYSLVGYNSSTRKFKLFNPWGIDSNSRPGIVELTASQITENFGYWAYTTDNATTYGSNGRRYESSLLA